MYFSGSLFQLILPRKLTIIISKAELKICGGPIEIELIVDLRELITVLDTMKVWIKIKISDF